MEKRWNCDTFAQKVCNAEKKFFDFSQFWANVSHFRCCLFPHVSSFPRFSPAPPGAGGDLGAPNPRGGHPRWRQGGGAQRKVGTVFLKTPKVRSIRLKNVQSRKTDVFHRLFTLFWGERTALSEFFLTLFLRFPVFPCPPLGLGLGWRGGGRGPPTPGGAPQEEAGENGEKCGKC